MVLGCQRPRTVWAALQVLEAGSDGLWFSNKKHLGLRVAEVFLKFWESFAFGLMF
jgi:hypothetical protein